MPQFPTLPPKWPRSGLTFQLVDKELNSFFSFDDKEVQRWFDVNTVNTSNLNQCIYLFLPWIFDGWYSVYSKNTYPKIINNPEWGFELRASSERVLEFDARSNSLGHHGRLNLLLYLYLKSCLILTFFYFRNTSQTDPFESLIT